MQVWRGSSNKCCNSATLQLIRWFLLPAAQKNSATVQLNGSCLKLDTEIKYATAQLTQLLWGNLDKCCNSATLQLIRWFLWPATQKNAATVQLNGSCLKLDTEINYATAQLRQVWWGSSNKCCNSATDQMMFVASYSEKLCNCATERILLKTWHWEKLRNCATDASDMG
jgi:hypothetical protein